MLNGIWVFLFEFLKFIEGMMTSKVVKQSIVDSFMEHGTLEKSMEVSDVEENSKMIVNHIEKYRVKWLDPLSAP